MSRDTASSPDGEALASADSGGEPFDPFYGFESEATMRVQPGDAVVEDPWSEFPRESVVNRLHDPIGTPVQSRPAESSVTPATCGARPSPLRLVGPDQACPPRRGVLHAERAIVIIAAGVLVGIAVWFILSPNSVLIRLGSD